MPDVATDGLSEAEQKYFDSRGEADLPGEAESAPAPAAADADPPAAPVPPVDVGADTKAEKPKEEPEAKTVPLAVMLEERREAREREKRMEERFQALVQIARPPSEAPKVPEVEADPLHHVKDVVEWKRQQEARFYQAQQEEALVTHYAGQAREFSQKQPDFSEAYAYWQKSIGEELGDAMGYADPRAISAEIQRFERAIVEKAARDGVNSAERVYNAAKRRGYAVKAAETAPKTDTPDAARQVETIKRGSEAAKSLGTAGGAPGEGELSLKALAEMDIDEFMAVSDKLFRKANGA